MWRIARKTIFPRWQKVHQTGVNCQTAKNENPQVVPVSIVPDEKKNSHEDGKQHAHKQQRPCWDDPHFHYKAFCSHVLETVGWFGTTAICLDLQHKILRNCYFEEKKKCLFSEMVHAMPRGRKKFLQYKDYSKADNVAAECSKKAQPLLCNSVVKCNTDKASSSSTSGLEKFSEMTNDSISALENSIGVMFIDHDKKQSFHFFKASAELGCPKGLFNLALCYETGCGTKVNLGKAAYYYEKAAMKGHKYALYNFAVYNIKGLGGVEHNFEKGIQLLKKAAEKGVSQAQVCLGVQYLEEGNWAEAYEMFMAASQKDTNAKYYLGMCYEYGWGVVQNSTIATEMYAKAAQNGHEEATLKLGMFYEHGIDPDTDFSMTLYTMLVDKGHKGAKIALENLHKKRKSRWKLKSQELTGDPPVSSYKSSMHPSSSLPDFRTLAISDNSTHQQRLLNSKVLHVSHHPSYFSSLSPINIQSKDMHCSLDLAVKSPSYLNQGTLIAANS